MTVIFGQPTPDENLKPGWNVQGTTSATGPDAPGYAQAGVTGNVSNVGQASAGYPNPPGALNANPSENSASYSQSILTNGSYSVASATGVNPTQIGQTVTLASVPATATAFGNPFGISAVLTLTGGTGVTAAYTVNGSSSVAVVSGGIVPGGAQVTLTYAAGDGPTAVAFTSVGL